MPVPYAYSISVSPRIPRQHIETERAQDPTSFISLHVTFIPSIGKPSKVDNNISVVDSSYILKPAKQGIDAISRLGLNPDLIICRTKYDLDNNAKERLALATMTDNQKIFFLEDVDNIYEIPSLLTKKGLSGLLWERLNSKRPIPKLSYHTKTARKGIRVGIFGNTESIDSYISLNEALKIASISQKINLEYIWLNSVTSLKKRNLNGIIVTEGLSENTFKKVLDYAMHNNLPALFISNGFNQLAKNLIGVKSSENLRLGTEECKLKRSFLSDVYKSDKITKRFRCFGITLPKIDISSRDILIGANDSNLVNFIELKDKKFFIGVAFHPEYDCTIDVPEPLIKIFLKNC